MHERGQADAEQRLRLQFDDTERTMLQQRHADGAAIEKARKKQRVGPDRKTDEQAAHRAACRRAPPDQAAQERRRKLRDGGEGQQPDRSQLCAAERAVVQIRHDHDGEDRKTARLEQEVAEVLAAAAGRRTALQHQWHDDVVGHHDRQRDALDDHHRGSRRKSSDEHRDAEQPGLTLDRERQHIHVAVDNPERKGDEPGERDRDDEDVDRDQVKRKQPARPADFGIAGILHHADMKLPGQQHDREKRQQRHGQEVADRRRVLDGPHSLRRLHRGLDQCDRAEHPERNEGADGEERHQLDDGLRCDRQHQAVLMLGRIGLSGSEQHREQSQRDRHEQSDVADDGNSGDRLIVDQDGPKRGSNRLELERDIGD